MKKLMLALTAVLCCVLTTTALTACDGDDELTPKTPEEQEEEESPYADPNATPVYGSVKFSFMTTEEMLTFCDVHLEYKNSHGDSLII